MHPMYTQRVLRGKASDHRAPITPMRSYCLQIGLIINLDPKSYSTESPVYPLRLLSRFLMSARHNMIKHVPAIVRT